MIFEANCFSHKHFMAFNIGEAIEHAKKNGLHEMDVAMWRDGNVINCKVKVRDMNYSKLEAIFEEHL